MVQHDCTHYCTIFTEEMQCVYVSDILLNRSEISQ